MTKEINDLREKTKSLGNRNKNTEAVDNETFLAGKKFILKACKVRYEKVFEITLNTSKARKEVYYNSFLDTIERCISKTLRSHYDIFYKTNKNDFIILLQNVKDVAGVEKAIDRLKSTLNEEIIDISSIIDFSYEVVSAND